MPSLPVPWRVETLVDHLRGEWLFEREIDNGVTVDGRAIFTSGEGDRLHYREDGRMTLPSGDAVEAYAEYLFACDDEQLTLFFPETPPQPFQSFALTREGEALTGDSLHDCPPDTYRSRIAFEGDGVWVLRHVVTGPRKAYVSVTRYRRARP